MRSTPADQLDSPAAARLGRDSHARLALPNISRDPKIGAFQKHLGKMKQEPGLNADERGSGVNARGARDCREHGVEIFVTVSVANDPGFAAGAVSFRFDECTLEEPAGRARHIVVQSYVFRRNTVHAQEVAQIVRLRLCAFAER